MKTYPDCIPCFVRQSLEAARLVSDDPKLHEEVLRQTLLIAAEMDYAQPPPAMGRDIHRLIRRLSGVDDPYHEAKHRFNDYILEMMPGLDKRIAQDGDPLRTAVKLAIAGNVVDFGVNINLSCEDIGATVDQALEARLDERTVRQFRRACEQAARILYVADNAGEIVFDRLLVETISRTAAPVGITVAVRGAPVLNDATVEDALQAGLDRSAAVISNGSDAPGCLLSDCSAEFHEHLGRADMVISKGQGNYETLSEVPHEAFFLLKAKCPVIAGDIGSEVGSLLLVRKPPSR